MVKWTSPGHLDVRETSIRRPVPTGITLRLMEENEIYDRVPADLFAFDKHICLTGKIVDDKIFLSKGVLPDSKIPM